MVAPNISQSGGARAGIRRGGDVGALAESAPPGACQSERRPHRTDAAATWFDAFMDEMDGVEFTQTLQREGGASTVAQQPFEALAVGRFDAHPGVEREAATVIPARHRLGVLRLKHTASGQRAQQQLADLGLSSSSNL